MGGLLDALRMAVPGIAAARTGYLQGQDQEQEQQRGIARQSMLDKLKEAMDNSTIAENNARARYYDDGGAGADAVTYVKDTDGNLRAMPKRIHGASSGNGDTSATTATTSSAPTAGDDNAGGRAGDANAGASAASSRPTATTPATALGIPTGVKVPVTAPKAPAAPRISKSGVVNPASGMIEDVFSDGSRKEVRKATADELAKATHVPGAGTGAGGAGGTGGGKMNARTTEAYLQSVADNAIKATGGDIQQAEYQLSLTPDGQKAFSMHLGSQHFKAAKQKFDRQAAIDRDVHPTMDTTNAGGPPPKDGKSAPKSSPMDTLKAAVGAPPPNYPGAAKPTGPAGNTNLDEHLPVTGAGSGSPVTAAADKALQARENAELSKSPRVQKAIALLRDKKATLAQLDSTGSFNAREKAYIRAAHGGTKP